MRLGDRTPRDRYFIIRLSVANSGSSDTRIPSFEVVDDAGNSYPEQADGSGVDKWFGLSRILRVAEAEQGAILFDVPPKHYKLRVADEADNFVYIDIPFNLLSEDPAQKDLDKINPK